MDDNTDGKKIFTGSPPKDSKETNWRQSWMQARNDDDDKKHNILWW